MSGAVLGGFWSSQKPSPPQNFLLIVHKIFSKSMDGKNLIKHSQIIVMLSANFLMHLLYQN